MNTPNVHTEYKSTIALQIEGGLAILYFVPEGGELGENAKRPAEDDNILVIDLWFWSSERAFIVDMLRNEGPVYIAFDEDRGVCEIRTKTPNS